MPTFRRKPTTVEAVLWHGPQTPHPGVGSELVAATYEPADGPFPGVLAGLPGVRQLTEAEVLALAAVPLHGAGR